MSLKHPLKRKDTSGSGKSQKSSMSDRGSIRSFSSQNSSTIISRVTQKENVMNVYRLNQGSGGIDNQITSQPHPFHTYED